MVTNLVLIISGSGYVNNSESYYSLLIIDHFVYQVAELYQGLVVADIPTPKLNANIP